MENPYIPSKAVIKKIRKETADTNTYTLAFLDKEKRDRFSFTPGQFVMVSVLGIGEAAISLSSSPLNRECFDITIHKVGDVTNAISSMKKKDSLWIRGPYGKGWPMEEARGKNLLIIAGGIGLPPLRGVIANIEKKREEYGQLEILYGARTPKDLIFQYEYDGWKKIKGARLEITVDEAQEKWDGNIGLVTSLFPKMVTHPSNAVVFTCGPEIMMLYVTKCLETMGFKEEQIYVSMERRMKCGVGKCGHCQIGSRYVCKDGPVFSFTELKKIPDTIWEEK